MIKENYILEDDKNISLMLNHLLFEEGYQVEVYENLADFKAALQVVYLTCC